MYQKLLKLIKKHKVIIIHRHTKPDGDAMGGQIGLKETLIHNFPGKKIYAVVVSSPLNTYSGSNTGA